jgi:hypothetical protein
LTIVLKYNGLTFGNFSKVSPTVSYGRPALPKVCNDSAFQKVKYDGKPLKNKKIASTVKVQLRL